MEQERRKQVGLGQVLPTFGTWTNATSTGKISVHKAAVSENGNILIDIPTDVQATKDNDTRGLRIGRIDVQLYVTGQALDSAMTPKLYKLDTSSAANSAVEISSTNTGWTAVTGARIASIYPSEVDDVIYGQNHKFIVDVAVSAATASTIDIYSIDVALKELSDSRS